LSKENPLPRVSPISGQAQNIPVQRKFGGQAEAFRACGIRQVVQGQSGSLQALGGAEAQACHGIQYGRDATDMVPQVK
jgi:hypothetical protein